MEQGGISSGDHYKVYNKSQGQSSQSSRLGVQLGPEHVASIAQADDVALCSNDIFNLQCLLTLTVDYCSNYNVELSSEKTKLIAFFDSKTKDDAEYAMEINPVVLNGKPVDFSSSADHVGISRTNGGNLENLYDRITAHKRAIGGIVSVGLAHGHRANPIATLHIQRTYGIPVLFSGLSALSLSAAELGILDHHLKQVCQSSQKLLPRTPDCVVYFLGGILPSKAQLHCKQLNLFGMVTRLNSNVLKNLAIFILSYTKKSSGSWFHHIRDLCIQYALPHPLDLLSAPPTKETFSKLFKARITDFWENELRIRSKLSSLKYFHLSFMSLKTPHPIWKTAKENPHEVNKARIQAILLSGRYRLRSLTKHWTNDGSSCPFPSCSRSSPEESIEHFLIFCPGLAETRDNLFLQWTMIAEKYPILSDVINNAIHGPPDFRCQFILDCSVLPDTISLVQLYGEDVLHKLFHLTRTFCYVLHRARDRILFPSQ